MLAVTRNFNLDWACNNITNDGLRNVVLKSKFPHFMEKKWI